MKISRLLKLASIHITYLFIIFVFYISITLKTNAYEKKSFLNETRFISEKVQFALNNNNILARINTIGQLSELMRAQSKSQAAFNIPDVVKKLNGIKKLLNAEDIYTLNLDGYITATTNSTITGPNQKIPNFEKLLNHSTSQLNINHYAILSSKNPAGRIIYYIAPISSENEISPSANSIAGILVAEVSLKLFDNFLESIPYPIIITDYHYNKIIATNQKANIFDNLMNLLTQIKPLAHNHNPDSNDENKFDMNKQSFSVSAYPLTIDGLDETWEIIFLSPFNYNFPIKQRPIALSGLFLLLFAITHLHFIIEKRRYLHEYKKNFTFLEKFIDAIPSPIFYKGTDGIYRNCNQSLCVLTKKGKDYIIGKKTHDILEKEEAEYIEKKDKELISNGKNQAYEVKLKDSYGYIHNIVFYKSCFFNEKGEVEGIIGVMNDITESKKIQNALTLEKERAELIAQVIPSAIFSVNQYKIITSWNKKAEEITGYKANEIIGKNCSVFCTDDCDKKCKLFQPGTTVPINNFKCSIKTKDKGIRLISKNANLIKDKFGKIMGGVESFEDITERVEYERRIHDSEQKLSAIFNNIESGVCMVSQDLKLLFTNKKILEWFPDITKMHKYTFFNDFFNSSVEESGALKKGFAPETLRKSSVQTIITKNTSLGQRSFRVSLTPIKDKDDHVTAFIEMITDITDILNFQRKLQETLKEQKLIFDTSFVGIMVIENHIISKVNKRMSEILSYNSQEMLNRDTSFIHISEKSYTYFNENFYLPLPQKEFIQIEYQLKTKQGEMIWCHLSGKSIDPFDITKGAIWVIDDISKRKKAEEAMITLLEELRATNQQLNVERRNAEKAMITKGQFLANMSHEIRTPMNSIIGFGKLLRRAHLTQRQTNQLNMILSNGELLLKIIDDILDISKMDAGKIVLEHIPFELKRLCHDIFRMIMPKINKHKISTDIEIQSSIPKYIIGDPTRLRQILMNLLNNAIKFTSEGKINLYVNEVHQNTLDPRKILLQFMVKDTGIGIDESETQQIFESFTQADSSTTRKFGGTGLGLSICKAICSSMGGKIWMESTKGEGSNCIFEVPFEVSEEHMKSQQIIEIDDTSRILPLLKKKPEVERRNMILIVEDNDSNRLLLANILDELNYSYEFALDGKEAIEQLRNYKYDLCLMDLQMPEMNGFEATKIIRSEISKDLPIFAVSAAVMTEDKEKAFTCGMNAFITKPIDIDKLDNLIKKYLKISSK